MKYVVGAINILSRGMQLLRDEGQDTADASAGCASTARFACEVSGAAMPLSSRNPPKRLRGGSMPRLSAVGISGLQAGEDVN